MTRTATIAERVADVRARIARAAARAGRDPASVRLIAVTKGVALDRIAEAAAAGLRDFGENRVQEAIQKMSGGAPGNATPLRGWTWHLIGRLQTNKVKLAVGRFAFIQSVDSIRLAGAIDEAAGRAGLVQRVLVQVNVGREAHKGGVAPEDLASLLDAVAGCRHVRVEGLMAIPPAVEDPERARPYFRDLRRLGEEARSRLGPAIEYSMGMSGDFEIAVEEGATMVRVGTAIFGARP